MSGFIELCGAPGVGKTTLTAALAGSRIATVDGPATIVPPARLTSVPRLLLRPVLPVLASAGGVATLARRPLLARVLTRAMGPEELVTRVVLPPGTVRDLLADLPGPGPEDPRSDMQYRRAALGWLEDTMRTLRLASALPRGVVALLDEGVVQRTISLVGTTGSASDRARLLARLPRPSMVVQLVAEPDLIGRRARARILAQRAPALHVDRDVEEVVALAQRDAHAIADATEELRASGVPVIDVSVSGTEDAITFAARVRDALDRAAVTTRD